MKDSLQLNFNREALKHLDALFGYAMNLCRDKTEAEDLVQETYLRATRAANELNPDSNIKSWMFVIMRNAWLNEVRHKHCGPNFVELDTDIKAIDSRDSKSNPHVVYLQKLEQIQVREAIESLPDVYREIILLRDFEGFTYQEIATVLSCPAGTVMSRLGRARGKLRELLSAWQTKKLARTV